MKRGGLAASPEFQNVQTDTPTQTMEEFYAHTLERLLHKGLLTREMTILVVCGGPPDKEVFEHHGFRRVTISNLDVRLNENQFAPFEWSFQDAEHLSYADSSFDFCVAHQGLHHCPSPHRALAEMYRVARKGLLAIEPQDTLLVRWGVKLNLGQQYEVAAVAGNRMNFGGVNNTPIPNYVFRWTEHEVEKTIRAYDPLGRPLFHYDYALRLPIARWRALKNKFTAALAMVALPLSKVFTWLFPRQCNNLAFVVEKVRLPEDMHPWLTLKEGKPALDAQWVNQHYGEVK